MTPRLKIAPPLVATAIGLMLALSSAFADSATWLVNPSSGDWNTVSNWTPGGPPNGPADTATFQLSAVNELSVSASTQVGAVIFDAGGSTLYKIMVGPGRMLSISGTGITNNSTFAQNFVTTVDSVANVGIIQFTDSATAGVLTSFTNEGTLVDGSYGGVTQFRNNSTASHGMFRNEGGLAPLASGGRTLFFDRSTASNGLFISHGGAFLSEGGLGSGQGGETVFYNDSTAGHGTFISMGDELGGAVGGTTAFFHNASAADGTFVANGAAPIGPWGGAAGGTISFNDNSTAANGTFFSNSAAVAGTRGGFINFWDSSTAGQGTFFLRGGAFASPNFGVRYGAGRMFFLSNSTADHGVFFLDGGSAPSAPGGEIDFSLNSSAGHGTFIINGGAVGADGGFMDFRQSSTAANGTFTNHGGSAGGARGGFIKFWDNSTSGDATFVNHGGSVSQSPVDVTTPTNGGIIEFNHVGNGMITNNGGTASSAGGGLITVNDAGSPTIITNGGTVSGARGGRTYLANTHDATLIANGGFSGGAGGSILFFPDSHSTARVAVFGNGDLTIDSFEHARDVTIGSIEGDGNVFLGANNLTVGSNDLTTLFSGVLNDGGRISGQSGGSLTKIGPGTLIFSGTNTYTGATTINEGELRIDGSITSDVMVNNGGTLGGSGRTGSVTVTSGGIVAPGSSRGLHINGNYVQNSGGVLKIEVSGTNPNASARLDITGSATLEGTLEVRFSNGFLPVSGQVIEVLDVDGTLAGSFAQIIFPDLRAGFQFQAEFVNGIYQITALNDGVAATGFLNISTRMRVGTGDDALISGFIVTADLQPQAQGRVAQPRK